MSAPCYKGGGIGPRCRILTINRIAWFVIGAVLGFAAGAYWATAEVLTKYGG